MSLTLLLPPPPPPPPHPKKVQLWRIFFVLQVMHASLPAELIFRENTPMNIKGLYM